MLLQGDGKPPRGGTARGPAVEYDTTVPTAWKELRTPDDIPQHERDRRAIYAMEGVFESRFEFIETIPMDTDKKADPPYASRGTEWIKVIEDRGNFISLQHIMVMFLLGENDQVQGPYTVKHWRQDWQWEGRDQILFEGDNTWSMKDIPSEHSQGGWVWTIWHVDDSPRYSGVGHWNHFESTSFFETDYMSRPLPRREYTVRSDYKLMMGKDTILVTPHTWHHEQKNFKHKEGLQNGAFNGTFVGREIGHNSYKRIANFDISSGQKYWIEHKDYWLSVKEVWKEIFTQKKRIRLKRSVNEKPLFMSIFEQAEDPKALSMTPENRKTLVKKTIAEYFES